MTYLDHHGRPLSLGKKLGEGGEGTVYMLGSEVAKIYHQPLTADRQRKILAMVAGGAATVKTIAAWPTGTLHRDVPGRPICGFSMPHAKGDLLHLHYAAKDRKAKFPREHWDFLVRVGQNLAAAVAILHEQGIVIGDINESLVMVDQQSSQVCLVDCDSFQVPNGAITHFCHVGTPDYTPPELMGKPFSGLTRTKEHDAFVIYAYGDRTGIQPPSLGEDHSQVMQNYFKRAFAPPRGPHGPVRRRRLYGRQKPFGNLKQCALEPDSTIKHSLPVRVRTARSALSTVASAGRHPEI